MIEYDKNLYRALHEATRQMGMASVGEDVAEIGDELDAALCGAQHELPPAMLDDEAQAGEEVALEKAGSLSARQSRVAAMLAGGMSVREAAIVTGLHRGTIFRWRQSSPAFLKEQQRCAAEASAELTTIARRLLVKATGYIDRLMEDAANRDEWAAHILRNRRLWELALDAKAEKAAGA